jgi:hypothetical protein
MIVQILRARIWEIALTRLILLDVTVLPDIKELLVKKVNEI